MKKRRFRPSGPRFIGKIINEEARTSGGLWKPTEYMDKRQQTGDTCEIIAIGDHCWKDKFDGKPQAKVGDIVACVKWSGAAWDGFEDDTMRVYNDEDLIVVIEEFEEGEE